MSAEVDKVFRNSNLLILDRYNYLGIDAICVIEYIKSWEKVDVDNVLFLVVIYKFGVGVGGHSARRLAGHLLKNHALRAGRCQKPEPSRFQGRPCPIRTLDGISRLLLYIRHEFCR